MTGTGSSASAFDFFMVYLLGSGHCGSTLLDMLLNAHSKIFALGEFVHFPLYLPRDQAYLRGLRHPPVRHTDAASPGTNPLRTVVWRNILHEYVCSGGAVERWYAWKSGKATGNYAHAKAREDRAREEGRLLWAIARVTRAHVLTDASKIPARLVYLRDCLGMPVKVLHLVRDPRGVVFSYHRKYGDWMRGVRQWVQVNIWASRMKRTFRPGTWMEVRYEDLVQTPETVLRQICSFLGLSFEDRMLQFRSTPYYGIGGNRMRLEESDRIRLDDAWTRDLPAHIRRLVWSLTFWHARRYGYRDRVAGGSNPRPAEQQIVSPRPSSPGGRGSRKG